MFCVVHRKENSYQLTCWRKSTQLLQSRFNWTLPFCRSQFLNWFSLISARPKLELLFSCSRKQKQSEDEGRSFSSLRHLNIYLTLLSSKTNIVSNFSLSWRRAAGGWRGGRGRETEEEEEEISTFKKVCKCTFSSVTEFNHFRHASAA